MSYRTIGKIYHADGQDKKAHDSFFRGIKVVNTDIYEKSGRPERAYG